MSTASSVPAVSTAPGHGCRGGGRGQAIPGRGVAAGAGLRQPAHRADHGWRHQGLRDDHRPDRAPAQSRRSTRSTRWASTACGRVPRSGSPRATRCAPCSPTTWTSRRASISTARRSPTRWTACRSSPSRRSSPASSSPTSSRPSPPARTCTTRTTTPPTRSVGACWARSSSTRRTRRSDIDAKYGTTQDIVWISNDAFGGFTINGRQFPATAPIVAKQGEQILIRFMNEGVMIHPWHLHGQPMRVVARDGYPLGSAAFTADTLGVNPGERWDVVDRLPQPGCVGVPLPHPAARRGPPRHVRHGHRARRPVVT